MTLSVKIQHRLGRFSLDAAFEAPPGITVLFGRSGSGKSSIMRAVAGLLTPQAGRIAIDEQVLFDSALGIDQPPHRRHLGYVFQDARLFPHLSVRQNLLYGRWFAKAQNTASIDKVIEMLGIGGLLIRRPASLSGGERQRVAIGRALLAQPRMLLADEPLASLDEPRKAEILPYFERLRDESDVPILYVTHAPAEVARLATTVVAIDAGRVQRQGPAVDVMGDPMVMPAGVRAVGAVLQARVIAHHHDGVSELLAGDASLFLPRTLHPVGTILRVRIAAQEVILSKSAPRGLSALNILEGTVERIRAGDGPGAIVSLRSSAGQLLARITRRSVDALDLREGTRCFAIIKALSIAPEDVGG